MPVSIAWATRCARARSLVQTYAARPYCVALARRIASVLVVERHRHEHRPEDLLLEDPHRLVDVGDHRRLQEVAALEARRAARRRRGCAPPAPEPSRCTRAPARSARRVISGPSSVRGSNGSPTRILRARSATAVHHLLVERPLDEEARPGRAALAVHGEDLRQRRVDRQLGIGVGEDDDRRLAAELGGHALQRRSAGGDDLLRRSSSPR